MMNEEVLVSIHCMAYNHEKYIADALEGFVKQKTNFKFEVLVHDDASTDNTAAIIHKYEEKYPDIIKAVYETENQYSKDKTIGRRNLQRAKGKYIAICEGDDYWTDENKLQKQVDYMQSHPECKLCFHDIYVYDMKEKQKIRLMDSTSVFNGTRKYDIEEVILMPTLPTSSMLYRKECMNNPPEFYKNAKIGDLALALYLSCENGTYGFDEPMSVYRYNVSGSVTTSVKDDRSMYNRFVDNLINIYNSFDKYTNYKYHNTVLKKIEMFENKKNLKKEAVNLVAENDNIYIYGTGEFAGHCFEDLKEYQPKIKGFIVSDGYEKKNEFMGKPVYYLSEIKPENNALLYGLGEKNIMEVMDNVEKAGWEKVSSTYSDMPASETLLNCDEIFALAKKCDNIYIYGYNTPARNCYDRLEEYHEKIKGFIIPYSSKLPRAYRSKPVYRLSDIRPDKNTALIVALNKPDTQVWIENNMGNGWENICGAYYKL